jgi:O-antigen/teichoic acid export membrane protein
MAAVGVAATSPFLVPLIFGEAFRPAVRLVWLLTPAYVAVGLATLLGLGLRGLDHPHVATVAGVGAAVVFGAVWILLRRNVSLIDVAIALDIAQVLMLIGLLIFVKRSYRLSLREMRKA